MTKKIVVCLVCLGVLLSFFGCTQPEDIRGQVSGNTVTTTPEETTAEPTVPQPEFSIGSSAGNTYKNEFIGIQCSLDETWVFKTDEEMQAINRTSAEMVGDEYKDMIANAAVVQDMMATNSNQTDTVNVVMEKLNGVAVLLTEEQYMSAAKDPAVNALSSMGLKIVSAEVVTLQFAGQEHVALTIEADVDGIPMYECMVVVKCSGYMVCVTACTWQKNTCMDILSHFEPC